MRTRPVGLDETQLIEALATGWGVDADNIGYVPEGCGSYHWALTDRGGQRYFVTVDDLDNKVWLGDTRNGVFEGLRRAFHTARVLRDQATLDFVVAPVPTIDDEVVLRLNSRYTIALFPFLDGSPSRWGQPTDPAERAQLVLTLVELHQATPFARGVAATHRLQLSARDLLDRSLCESDRRWTGGPFSEPARTLLRSHADDLADLLGAFDRLAAQVSKAQTKTVITHGEPHSGNVKRVGSQLVLFDWDTVALALPERDLWIVATDTGEEAALYAGAAGRQLDETALTLYRLRWDLEDTGLFLSLLRSAHDLTDDTDQAWTSLTDCFAGMGAWHSALC